MKTEFYTEGEIYMEYILCVGGWVYINIYTAIPEVRHMNLIEPPFRGRAVIKDILGVTRED